MPFDYRPEVKKQVQIMGAEFLEDFLWILKRRGKPVASGDGFT